MGRAGAWSFGWSSLIDPFAPKTYMFVSVGKRHMMAPSPFGVHEELSSLLIFGITHLEVFVQSMN